MIMGSWLKRFEPWTFRLFRIVFGVLFVFHGLQKLFGLFGGPRVAYTSRLGAAGVIELVGGALRPNSPTRPFYGVWQS